jgi:large subunit ribosomal protein L4
MEDRLEGKVDSLRPIQPELKPEIFFFPVRTHLLHELVQKHLAVRRAGTVATKTKGLVRGGGKKPWKQKGTGRARAGSIRSPIWVGGGTVFGPQSRGFPHRPPKSARMAGLKSALSWKRQAGKLVVVEDFDLPEIKTKHLASLLNSIGLESVLLVIPKVSVKIEKSAQNLSWVKVLKAHEINVYDVLRYHTIVLTRQSLGLLEKKLER